MCDVYGVHQVLQCNFADKQHKCTLDLDCKKPHGLSAMSHILRTLCNNSCLPNASPFHYLKFILDKFSHFEIAMGIAQPRRNGGHFDSFFSIHFRLAPRMYGDLYRTPFRFVWCSVASSTLHTWIGYFLLLAANQQEIAYVYCTVFIVINACRNCVVDVWDKYPSASSGCSVQLWVLARNFHTVTQIIFIKI